MRNILLTATALLIYSSAFSQQLKPGFDKEEYIELLKVCSRNIDSAYRPQVPDPQHHKRIYRSPVVGLDNQWSLWKSEEGEVAVISIRGTTLKAESWLADFYAAMVPAKGILQLSPSDTFSYQLAEHPDAAVHVGWLLSTAYLSRDIIPKIDSCYKEGVREFVIMGHSQGGAISYLLTALIHNLQSTGELPSDIRFKTYCSAAPKPGNLFFAYHYESITFNGWAFNVVNSADWVPQTPISIQTLEDFNKTNPFVNIDSMISQQKLPTRIALHHAYKELNQPTLKARKNYIKYLGEYTSGMVKKYLKDYTPPQYYDSNYYVRTGHNIVLFAEEDYYKLHPDNSKNAFIHHAYEAYLYLAERL